MKKVCLQIGHYYETELYSKIVAIKEEFNVNTILICSNKKCVDTIK